MKSREERIQRGKRAATLLGDSLLAEAFLDTQEAVFRQWKDTPVEAVAEREALWATLQGIEAVQKTLRVYQSDGEIAENLE